MGLQKEKKEHDPYSALRYPEFRFFITARIFLVIAIQIQSVAVGWQIYELTKDPLSLGFIGLSEAIPSIMVALFAGYLADISNRKKLILSFLSIFLFCAFTLFLFTFDDVKNIIAFNVLHLYAVIFISGIARGFVGPAIFGFMGQIVPKEIYPNSSLWGSTVFQFGLVLGPALGGLMYGFLGIKITYLVDTILILISISAISFIASKPVPEKIKDVSLSENLLAGIKFVFGHKIILPAITLDLFAVLFGGAVAILPIFADQILNVGPKGLGILRAAPAAGAVVVSWFIAHNPFNEKTGRNLLISVAGFGVCMVLFALSKNFYISLLLLALSGMFDNVSVVTRVTIIQLMTPDHMRGRVSAVNSIFIGSSNEIGAFESGLAAKIMGTVPSVVFGGIMTLLVVGIISLKSEKLRGLNLSESNTHQNT